MEYTIKQVQSENFSDIARAFNETRSTKISKKFFRKKLNSSYTGDYIGFIAYDVNTTPVAHAGVLPQKILVEKEIIQSGLSGDTVTHPLHQRKGLFVKVMQESISLSKERGIQILFRIPNPNTFSGLIKHLGYTHIDNFHVFTIPTKCWLPIIKICNKFKLFTLRRLLFRLFSFPFSCSRNKPFESSSIRHGFYSVPHDAGFFKYKTYSENFYLKMTSNRVWAKLEDGLVIGDMQFQNEALFLNQLKRFCFWAGIHQLKFYVSEKSAYFNMLKKYAEPQKDLPICVKNIGNVEVNIDKIVLTYADHDMF